MWTDKQIKAARDAVAVQDGVNGRAIAQALVKAYDAWIEATMDTTISNRCPPAILILDKLCDLAGLDHISNVDRFGRCYDQCQEIRQWAELQDAHMKIRFVNDEVQADFESVREFAEKNGCLQSFEQCLRGLGHVAGDNQVQIGPDFAEHSFTFLVCKEEDGKMIGAGVHGGMIFHRTGDKPVFSLHT